MDFFKSMATVFTIFLSFISFTYAINNCTVVVFKPVEVCTQKSNTTYGACCDEWCTILTCENTIYYSSCLVEYHEINQCCEGYGGQNCQPVCSTGCNVNGQCVSPNNCKCINGWTGINCQQVSGLKATDIVNNSFSLSWDTPDSTSNINGYYFYLQNVNNSNFTVFNIINKTIIENLEPFTDYRACVIPLVLEGNGTELCIDVQTAQGVPISPPLDVTVSGVSSAAVLIKWLPPTQPNGNITSYTLYINFSNNSNIDVVVADGRLSLYFINGLAMNQNVGVSIIATTVIGNGPLSMAVFNKTTDIPSTGISPNTVNGNIQLTPLTDSKLQLSWIPSSSNNVSFYLLSVLEPTENSTLYQWALRPDQCFEYILELEKFVPYVLKESVGNIDMNGYGLLRKNTFFVKEGVPSVFPSNISAVRLTEDSIGISWYPLSLSQSRGILTSYTVQYSKGVGSCDYTFDNEEMTTSNTNVVLENVAIDMIYCVSIFASTKEGNGPSSTPPAMVPLKEYTPVSLYLFGINDCQNWMAYDNSCSDVRITELRQKLITVLNENCSCISSASHFFEEQFVCRSARIVEYTANLIGSHVADSLVLANVIQDWTNENPNVMLHGMSLSVSMTNNTTDTDLCPELITSTDITLPTILGILLAISIVCLILALVYIVQLKIYVNRLIINPSINIEKTTDGSQYDNVPAVLPA